jgi:hypothetical protein
MIRWRVNIIFVCFLLELTACSPNSWPNIATRILQPGLLINPAQVEVRFNVLVPETSDNIYLHIVDEVTGIPYHTIHYRMEKKSRNLYSISLPFLQNAIIKYRFSKKGIADDLECDNFGRVVNYRTYYAPAPAEITDAVYNWTDNPISLAGGTITGKIVEKDKQKPVGSILVSAAGRMTQTDSLGNFTLKQIPVGIQNIVALSPDGSYTPFQQGANVHPNAITVANISIQPVHWVNLTFRVSAPIDMPENNPPIRLLGNLLDLGDTYAELKGGVSLDPLRAPVLVKQSDGQYALSLKLPAGLDLQYKYSMGDGFWNAEHTQDGQILTRELIVPQQDRVISDQIAAWGIPGINPVIFKLTVPENTPQTSQVSIQLAPFTWMEPVPMWPAGNNQWNISLFPPMAGLSNIAYQFCRDHICEINGNIESSPHDSNSEGAFTFAGISQNKSIIIKNWALWENPAAPVTIDADQVSPKGSKFIAAVEISPSFSQNKVTGYIQGIQHIRQLGANWIFLTPQWSWNQFAPFAEKSIDNAIYEPDLAKMTQYAIDNNLSVAYYPEITYPQLSSKWWGNNPHDAVWWDDWFKSYQEFILDQATLAEKNHAGMFIVGGPAVMPAMPGGTLKNGTHSGVFPDALGRWQNITKSIRDCYHGALVWAVSNEDTAALPDGIMMNMDAIYLLYSASILDGQQNLNSDPFKMTLDPLQRFNKPILLGIEYPSTFNSANGCKWNYASSCWETNNTDSIDLNQQLAVYKMIFRLVNQNTAFSGIVSRGFTPSGPQMDSTSSVYGKPASALIWYWYPRWISSP